MYATGELLDARNNALREILLNEMDYYQKLQLICDNYIEPLSLKMARGKKEFNSFTHIHMSAIFSNITQLKDISESIGKGLEDVFQKWPECNFKVSALRSHLVKLDAYSLYIQNFKHGQNVLRQLYIEDTKFKKFVDEQKDQDLHTLLKLPVDRIRWYHNSWERVLKHTPENHVDHADCLEISSIFSQLNAYCEAEFDQSTHQAEIEELKGRMDMIETHVEVLLNLWNTKQTFFKTGSVYLNPYNPKKKQDRFELFLFSSTLIIAKKYKGKDKERVSPKRIFNLRNQISVLARQDATTGLEFKEDMVMTPLFFTTPQERDEWIDSIRECVLDISPKNPIFNTDILSLPRTQTGIPTFLQDCCIQIIQRGQKTFYSNLFSETNITENTAREIRFKIQANLIIDWSVYTEKELGKILYHFFDRLPEPLFTYDLFPKFLEIIDSSAKVSQKVQSFQSALRTLPNKLQKIIMFVFSFFEKLCSINLSEVTPSGIAVLFGHTLLRRKGETIERKLVDGPRAGRVIQFLLHHHVFEEKFDTESSTSEQKKNSNPTEVHSSGTELKLKTLYAFKARKEGELTIEKDDVIKVTEQHASRWWRGINERTKQTGKFPQNYCKIIEGHHLLYLSKTPSRQKIVAPPSLSQSINSQPASRSADRLPDESEKKLIAVHGFTARKDVEISFEKGDVISVIEKHKSGWWIGECHGKTGRFPRNYCSTNAFQSQRMSSQSLNNSVTSGHPPAVPMTPHSASFYMEDPTNLSQSNNNLPQHNFSILIPSADSTPRNSRPTTAETSPRSGSSKKEKSGKEKKSKKSSSKDIIQEPATAKYSFIGRSEKELSFNKGDVLTIIRKSSSSWWKAEFNGKVGKVPANYF